MSPSVNYYLMYRVRRGRRRISAPATNRSRGRVASRSGRKSLDLDGGTSFLELGLGFLGLLLGHTREDRLRG